MQLVVENQVATTSLWEKIGLQIDQGIRATQAAAERRIVAMTSVLVPVDQVAHVDREPSRPVTYQPPQRLLIGVVPVTRE
ncbi:MAG: hypothetical protein Ct9H300mP1_38350 [Planctomycetaceae bacterium]|nr:MAG: hypothetical protein Ct9H300mP1_38350 [Planctomycetaceae bacterium]